MRRIVADALREISKYFSWKEACRCALLSRMAASIIIPRIKRALDDGVLTRGEGGQFTYRLNVSKDSGKCALVDLERQDLNISIIEGRRNSHTLYLELSKKIIEEGEKIVAFNVSIADEVLTAEGIAIKIVDLPSLRALEVKAELEIP